MTINNLYQSVLVAALLGSVPACVVGEGGADGDDAASYIEDETISPEDSESILNGTPVGPGGHRAVVFYNGCTGALIAPNVVLTAKHCTEGTKGKKVFFGNNKTDFKKPDAGIGVRKIRRHPFLDVAVLALQKSVSTKPLALQTKEVFVTQKLRTVGFGKPSPFKKRVGSQTVRTIYTDGSFTAGGVGSNSCPGDSGAPYIDSGNKIVGVVSGGSLDGPMPPNGCGFTDAVGIPSARKFINMFIKAHAKNK